MNSTLEYAPDISINNQNDKDFGRGTNRTIQINHNHHIDNNQQNIPQIDRESMSKTSLGFNPRAN